MRLPQLQLQQQQNAIIGMVAASEARATGPPATQIQRTNCHVQQQRLPAPVQMSSPMSTAKASEATAMQPPSTASIIPWTAVTEGQPVRNALHDLPMIDI